MAADQERADRIRQVRQDKHLRWKQIAAYVGVEMRSAQMWQETGAISWDNAVKFAELAGVDAHWLMSGAETTTTPDLFAGSQLDQIQQALQDISDRLARLEAALTQVDPVALMQAAAEEFAAVARQRQELAEAQARTSPPAAGTGSRRAARSVAR